MSIQSLSKRLYALSESHKTTLHLIHRLSKLTFEPGSTPVDGDEGDVRVELSSDIHESLKQQEEDLDLLRQEVEEITSAVYVNGRRRDSDRDRERARLAAQVARLGEDLRNARSQFRKAQLTAKRASEAAKQRERELLFSGIQSGSDDAPAHKRRRGPDRQNPDAVLADASSDVTAALRRTHALLAAELSRSRFAQETLEQSSSALKELSDHYTGVEELLSRSRQLVGTLLRSQKTDTWYLDTALYILLATVVWLVFRRFLYGPLWLLVWFPVRTGFRLFFWFLGAIGLTGGAVQTGSAATALEEQLPRTSLIVKPSAKAGLPRLNTVAGDPAPFIRSGMGGSGAKKGPNPDNEEPLAESVGRMAEESRQQQEQPKGEGSDQAKGDAQDDARPVVRRGDGTVLVESDAPRNPKKRVLEEPKVVNTPGKDEL